ncbi:MAG: aminotransferase class V-fold PLP-dependent enzyme [Candidatus Lokiarchaeota archaeon]|nr:aminotransferase class V-fold PLP-dependent enzyme [Candidatus Lokiarchaeota archaeon]
MKPLLTLEEVRDALIGRYFTFQTPYGMRLLTYADYTASGRSLRFIEKYLIKIQREYANTHTEDNVTGRHMTNLLHQAEKIIKKAFNAESNCRIIAIGTGATGAITKFQEIIGIRLPPATKKLLIQLIDKSSKEKVLNPALSKIYDKEIDRLKPVVFIGPYEHHSNDIMWREAIAEVISIQLNTNGGIDLKDLENQVSDPKYKDRLKIGSFSAASNITGIKSPVYEIARIMHKYGGLVCFDYAASAPYVKINMNKNSETFFDAIFISPHKFVGGPGSSGILVFNERIYDQTLSPTAAGGGTVDFVSATTVDYSEDIEVREKAGTPGVLQTIKAALAIDLKDALGFDTIASKEREYTTRALERLFKHPNIEILGPHDPKNRISIVSFTIKHGDKKLHPKFITKLLNDLFGIQSRAGCMCAGPYGHLLLQISEEKSQQLRKITQRGKLGLKPGWCRVTFHYLFSEVEFQFICQSIEFIADYGYLLLKDYSFNINTGEWVHINFKDVHLSSKPDIKTVLSTNLRNCFEEEYIDQKKEFTKYLKYAKDLVYNIGMEEDYLQLEDSETEKLRWFNFSHTYED